MVPSFKLNPIVAAVCLVLPTMAYAQDPKPSDMPTMPSAEPAQKPEKMPPKAPSLLEIPEAAVEAPTPVAPPSSLEGRRETPVNDDEGAMKADYPVCSNAVTDNCVQPSQAKTGPVKKRLPRKP